jgi:hypothetical protein
MNGWLVGWKCECLNILLASSLMDWMFGNLFVCLFVSLPVGSSAVVGHYQAVFFSISSCLSHALNTEHRTHHDVLPQNFKTRVFHRSTTCRRVNKPWEPCSNSSWFLADMTVMTVTSWQFCMGTSHRPDPVVANVQHSVKHSQTLARIMTVDRRVLQSHSVPSHLFTMPTGTFHLPQLITISSYIRPLIPSCLLPSYFHSPFLSPVPAEGHSATDTSYCGCPCLWLDKWHCITLSCLSLSLLFHQLRTVTLVHCQHQELG